MNKLSKLKTRKLLDMVKKIYAHKCMQSKGFFILAKRAREERIKKLLQRISSEEATLAEFWFEKIKELGGKPEARQPLLRDWKIGFMFRILGTKGFFEWTIVGEEERIHDLAIQAENIKEPTISGKWSRTASDERLHLERIKTEVLDMEAWEIRGGGGIKDMVFGANDGLVSTLAFVVGAFGAFTDARIVLVTGIAELFAGTLSMGVGSYQSSKSEVEVWERKSQRKKVKIGRTQEEMKEELIKYYQREGFNREEAKAIAKRIAEEKEEPAQTDTLEQLGLEPEELGSPTKSGALCGISFGLAALVPILPFAFSLGSWEALTVSILATVITLFGVGAMKTIFSRKNWFKSGLEMMLIGVAAAGITYLIGTLFSLII